jgi:poly(beta-D-mannuronate) lyase
MDRHIERWHKYSNYVGAAGVNLKLIILLAVLAPSNFALNSHQKSDKYRATSNDRRRECAMIQPVLQPRAFPVYKDKEGSVVDAMGQRRTNKAIAPMRNFLTIISRSADRSGDAITLDCAKKNLDNWARSGALLEPSENFFGNRQLIRYAIALNVIVAKLGTIDTPLDGATQAWLRQLTKKVASNFEGNPRRVNNLYVWSGVAAATGLLNSPDQQLESYQQRVWSRAISAIRPDGTVEAELHRGTRALMYHSYYLSAIIWLERLRNSLGHISTTDDNRAIARLKRRVLRGLCSSTNTMTENIERQIKPTPIAYRDLFYLADRDMREELTRCGLQRPRSFDPLIGGDLLKINELLRERSHLGKASHK